MNLVNLAMLIMLVNNLLMIITMLMNTNINKKHSTMNMNFECGFNEKTILKIPFSINFFMITILFLIFDLEISLITPLILMNNLSKISMLFLMLFIITITIMLMNEWLIGMMEWTK